MLFKISIKYYITIIFSLFSSVKRYAVRNVKIRQYAVRRVKIRQYARGRGVSPSVSVIVHTPITSLFKGAQSIMNYAVWVLISLCCAATKCPVRQCFMHCLHYVAKLKQVWVLFFSFFTQMEKKKISIA